MRKLENLERRLMVQRELLVEKGLKLEGWPVPEPAESDNPIKKKLCKGCNHFGKGMKTELSGEIYCAGCRKKNRQRI